MLNSAPTSTAPSIDDGKREKGEKKSERTLGSETASRAKCGAICGHQKKKKNLDAPSVGSARRVKLAIGGERRERYR